MKRKVIKTNTAKIWLDDDGIVWIMNLANSKTNLENAKKNVAATKMFGPKKRPLVVDISQIKSISREAREYFATDETLKRTEVMALLIGSPISSVIGNFFYGN